MKKRNVIYNIDGNIKRNEIYYMVEKENKVFKMLFLSYFSL